MIQLINLSKKFKNKSLFDNLSVNIFNNGLYKISGPSGAGKTTLIKCICGLESQDNGNVLIDNDVYNKDNVIGNKIFYLDARGLLIRNFSFTKNLTSLPFNISEEKIDYYLNLFNVKNLINTKLNLLSEGEIQTLNLVYFLSTNYEYYFLDEPFNGIDKAKKEILKKILIEKSTTCNITIVDHENNIDDNFFATIIDLYNNKIIINQELTDLNIQLNTSENKKPNYFKIIKSLFSKNKFSYIFNAIFLSISTIFLTLGAAFTPMSSTKLEENIIANDPYTYLQAGTYDKNINLCDIIKKDDNNESFVSINPATSIFFMPHENSPLIAQSTYNFDTDYNSNIVFSIENDIPDNAIYYEIDPYYTGSVPLLNIQKNNEDNFSKITLINKNNSLYKASSYFPYSNYETSFLGNVKRTDYLRFSENTFIDFINSKTISKLETPSGKKLVANDNVNILSTDNKQYKTKIVDGTNVLSLGKTPANTSISFLTKLNNFDVKTTKENKSLEDNEAEISFDLLVKYLQHSPDELKLFVNKNNHDFLKNNDLEMVSTVLNNYKNEDVFLYYTIAFYSVGGVFLLISIIYFILSDKKISKNSSTIQTLKSYGLSNLKAKLISYTPYILISIFAILLGIIALSASFSVTQIVAYKNAFSSDLLNPLYSLNNNMNSLYNSLDLIYIRDFMFYGIIISIIPALLLLLTHFLIANKYENRTKKH